MIVRRMFDLSLATIALMLAGISANAAEPTTQPAKAPTSKPAPLTPVIEKILDRLEARGKTLKDIEANIVYTKEDTVLNAKHKYEGILRFKEEQPNPRFYIRFDKSNNDGVVSDKKEWHVFDGEFYKEAREEEKDKGTISKHRVVQPGQKTEVFRLGKGPFPVPFGQKKGDIVQHFSVQLIPQQPGDPKNTDHLRCEPLPGTEIARDYDTVHFYIDRDLDIPVKLTTVEKKEDQQISATFTNLKVNKGMVGSDLNLPDLPGYSIQEDEPLGAADNSGK